MTESAPPGKAMRFFFYGTLMAGSDNAAARLVERKLRELGPCKVRGRLYAVPDPDGRYPALLPDGSVAKGVLYQATASFTLADLAVLDAYEEYDPARSEGSPYRREAVTVTTTDGECAAQAYRFVGPLPAGSRPIADGDFRAWLTETGLTAFPGCRPDS